MEHNQSRSLFHFPADLMPLQTNGFPVHRAGFPIGSRGTLLVHQPPSHALNAGRIAFRNSFCPVHRMQMFALDVLAPPSAEGLPLSTITCWCEMTFAGWLSMELILA